MTKARCRQVFALVLVVLFLNCREKPAIATSTSVEVKQPTHPVVNDPRLVANPKERFVGPREQNPFIGTDPVNMTEDNCIKQGCNVVQGSGPTFATWCGCGKAEKRTYTYIHM